MLPASEDAPRVREHIDRLEASSREEAFRSNSAPPTTRGQGEGSSEKGEEGSVGAPPTPERAAPRPIPAPSPPYLPDTRPATVAVSSETTKRDGEGQEHPEATPPPEGWFGVSEQDAALSVPTTRPSRRDVLADREEEPGWMQYLFLGEAGRRPFPFGRAVPSQLRPLCAWVPVAVRVPQGAFALLAFAVAASMKHDATDCPDERPLSTSTTTDISNGTSSTINDQRPHALCLPGRSFTNFASLEFLVVANVAAFVWACFFFFGDLLCLGKVRLGREIAAKTSDVTTEQTLRRATSLGVPRLAFWGDAALCFLTLVSAAAAFGFLSGGENLGAGYCDGVGRGWCDRMAAAAAFGTCAFVAYLPSVMINAANDVGPW